MNNIFDFKRFGHYFVYDVRRSVSRFGTNVLVMGLVPVILFMAYEVFSLVLGYGFSHMALGYKLAGVVVAPMVICMLAPAKIYGKITDRRFGSEYLMLPASTLEKWISMVLMVCIVLPVSLVVIMLASDTLLGLCFPNHYGTAALFAGNLNLTGRNVVDGVNINFLMIVIMNWCENVLVFTLGAICFRKSKVAKTILAYFLACLVFGMLFSIPFGTMSVDTEHLMEKLSIYDGSALLSWVNAFLNVFYAVIFCGLLGAIYYRIRTIKQ